MSFEIDAQVDEELHQLRTLEEIFSDSDEEEEEVPLENKTSTFITTFTCYETPLFVSAWNLSEQESWKKYIESVQIQNEHADGFCLQMSLLKEKMILAETSVKVVDRFKFVFMW